MNFEKYDYLIAFGQIKDSLTEHYQLIYGLKFYNAETTINDGIFQIYKRKNL